MSFQEDTFWKRCALIAEFAHRFSGRPIQFGKTVLQKVLFLFQEHYGVDLGYSFELYTYGPFSSEVLQDLDLAESFDAVKVESVESGYGGYHIRTGSRNIPFRRNQCDFLESEFVHNALNSLMKDFGNFTAKDLELRSTIIFIHKDLKETPDYTEETLLDLVRRIKSKFSTSEIQQAIDELKTKGIIVFS